MTPTDQKIAHAIAALERADAASLRFHQHAERIMEIQFCAIAVLLIAAIVAAVIIDRRFRRLRRVP